ncbi:MAG: hypothetical protein R2706_11610 [Acidimicrobiales bacterium]
MLETTVRFERLSGNDEIRDPRIQGSEVFAMVLSTDETLPTFTADTKTAERRVRLSVTSCDPMSSAKAQNVRSQGLGEGGRRRDATRPHSD